jgi:hypothetical protein
VHALPVTVGHSRPGRGGNGLAGGPAGSRQQPVFGSRAGARADVRAPGPGVQARRLARLLRPARSRLTLLAPSLTVPLYTVGCEHSAARLRPGVRSRLSRLLAGLPHTPKGVHYICAYLLYALDGILTREFTRRRHAPATAPGVVILHLEGGLPIRPDCDSMTHGNGPPLAFVQLGRRVWPEVASPPRRLHKSRHQPGGTSGPGERRGPWRRPRRQRWRSCPGNREFAYLFE